MAQIFLYDMNLREGSIQREGIKDSFVKLNANGVISGYNLRLYRLYPSKLGLATYSRHEKHLTLI